MLLTDEEIHIIADGYQTGVIETDNVISLRKSIAKAQLKKLIEWLPKDCDEHKHTVMMIGKETPVDVMRCDCPECWQALLKEVE